MVQKQDREGDAGRKWRASERNLLMQITYGQSSLRLFFGHACVLNRLNQAEIPHCFRGIGLDPHVT